MLYFLPFLLHNVLLLFTRILWLGIMLPSFKLHNVLLLYKNHADTKEAFII